MLKLLLFLILECTYVFTSESENTKQQKRYVDHNKWILSNSYGYPWIVDQGFKLSDINLHAGLHLDGALSYDKSGIALTPGIPKTLPVYITKHVILEKPVPKPVIIEKPYHVSVAKVVPVQHPYPVPVKHSVPIPVPIRIESPSVIAGNGLGGVIYEHNYAPGHFVHLPVHFSHSIDTFDDGFGHEFSYGISHGFGNGFEHGLRHILGHHNVDYRHHSYRHEHEKIKAYKN